MSAETLYAKWESMAHGEAASMIRRFPQIKHAQEDVYGAARLGLWEAARKFDSGACRNPDVAFFVFGKKYVSGSIKNLCRTMNIAFAPRGDGRTRRHPGVFSRVGRGRWQRFRARPVTTETMLRRIIDDVEEHAAPVVERGTSSDGARSIARLYFEHDLTMREIGTWFGLSKAGVHQIIAKAIRKARAVA